MQPELESEGFPFNGFQTPFGEGSHCNQSGNALPLVRAISNPFRGGIPLQPPRGRIPSPYIAFQTPFGEGSHCNPTEEIKAIETLLSNPFRGGIPLQPRLRSLSHQAMDFKPLSGRDPIATCPSQTPDKHSPLRREIANRPQQTLNTYFTINIRPLFSSGKSRENLPNPLRFSVFRSQQSAFFRARTSNTKPVFISPLRFRIPSLDLRPLNFDLRSSTFQPPTSNLQLRLYGLSLSYPSTSIVSRSASINPASTIFPKVFWLPSNQTLSPLDRIV